MVEDPPTEPVMGSRLERFADEFAGGLMGGKTTDAVVRLRNRGGMIAVPDMPVAEILVAFACTEFGGRAVEVLEVVDTLPSRLEVAFMAELTEVAIVGLAAVIDVELIAATITELTDAAVEVEIADAAIVELTGRAVRVELAEANIDKLAALLRVRLIEVAIAELTAVLKKVDEFERPLVTEADPGS